MALPALIAAALLVLHGCSEATTASDGEPSTDAADVDQGAAETPTDADIQVSWLDGADLAVGQALHRMGGTVSGPRTVEGDLRRIARDALVERARSLGFRRLDDLQIEVACSDEAPAASACAARIIAVASR